LDERDDLVTVLIAEYPIRPPLQTLDGDDFVGVDENDDVFDDLQVQEEISGPEVKWTQTGLWRIRCANRRVGHKIERRAVSEHVRAVLEGLSREAQRGTTCRRGHRSWRVQGLGGWQMSHQIDELNTKARNS
jgi:hypothetical protein